MRLRRVTDATPGIRRRRQGTGFTYIGPDGKRVSRKERRRVEALAIPPAWQQVWVCADPRGHIQATGVDARGRKQYIYHPQWQRIRGTMKFERLEAFGRALPTLREQVDADLARSGLPREKVVAAVVRIMEHSFIRIGNDRYAKDNRSFGATTLLGRHVQPGWQTVRFRFRGKGGRRHEVEVHDARLALVVRRCRELPGHRLFEYQDESGVHVVDSGDVNEYLRDAMDGDFTSKDLRTWSASVLMLHALLEAGPRQDDKGRMKVLRQAVKDVARRMQHTVAVCKKSYIHPAVAAAYFDGSLEARVDGAQKVRGLFSQEERLLALLRSYA